MGYKTHLQSGNHFRKVSVSITLALLSLLLALWVPDAALARPVTLPPGQWDHLIITPVELAPAFDPLIIHRTEQGLRSRVLTLEEICVRCDTLELREAVRATVAAAAEQWGTRYVLLGGGAESIPVPLGHFEYNSFAWEIPLDLYYAAPDGQWDLDGDGYLGEWEDDAPDLRAVVALGRIAVDSAAQAASYVSRLIEFEHPRTAASTDVLIAGPVAIPVQWFEGQEVFRDFTDALEAILEPVQARIDAGQVDRLCEDTAGNPGSGPLTNPSFCDAIADGGHRLVAVYTYGVADCWEWGPTCLQAQDIRALSPTGEPFFALAAVPEAADCRQPGVLQSLMQLPAGGCVGALAPSSCLYAYLGEQFYRSYFTALGKAGSARAGDAFLAAQEAYRAEIPPRVTAQATYQCLSLVGDPAVLVFGSGNVRPVADPVENLSVRAAPNPFNPSTVISFEVPDGGPWPVSVEIFDLAGRRVAHLLDAALGSGPQQAVWRGRDDAGQPVGSGLYFAGVRVGNDRKIIKLALVE